MKTRDKNVLSFNLKLEFESIYLIYLSIYLIVYILSLYLSIYLYLSKSAMCDDFFFFSS